MAKKDNDKMWVKLSGWLFILGIIIAVVAALPLGVIGAASAAGILAVLGLIIGLLGIAGMGTLEKCDIDVFLLAVIALMVVGVSGNAFALISFMGLGAILNAAVSYVGILVAPAAVLIALKAIWKSAQTKF
jgi:hypothetical protein